MKVSTVFEKNYDAKTRIVANQGGTRSSKTYSLCQLMLIDCLNPGRWGQDSLTIDIMRKTTPSLKGTVLKDWIEILNDNNIKYTHNKTDNVFTINKSTVNFLSVDDPQKIRGRKRDILWPNETNEFTYEDWKQLIFRTKLRAYIDFNPSDEFHWIYDKIFTRDDCTFIKSTYKDNPFLEPELIKEIERLEKEDPNYWNIYGLGERGVSQEIIYSNWSIGEMYFEPEQVIYGLDFGFRVPTSLHRYSIRESEVYTEEIIYETNLTNSDIINRLNDSDIDGNDFIYADNAEPDRIQEIYDAGYNIHPANKSIKAGIDHVKTYKIIIDKNAIGMQKEIKHYKNKVDKEGNVLDEPVKFNDHAMDDMRYALYTNFMENGYIKVRTW